MLNESVVLHPPNNRLGSELGTGRNQRRTLGVAESAALESAHPPKAIFEATPKIQLGYHPDKYLLRPP